MVLPARADTMTVTASTVLTPESGNHLASNGELTFSGFDASLGTLTEVDVSAELDVSFEFTNTGTGLVTIPGFDLSEAPTLVLRNGPLVWGASDGGSPILLFSGRPFSDDFELSDAETISSADDLARFTTTHSLVGFASNAEVIGDLPAGVTFSSVPEMQLDVTYDYTPFVTSTPEPASLLLLGTMAVSFLALRRRRNAKLNR
jgi:hypothetical protein